MRNNYNPGFVTHFAQKIGLWATAKNAAVWSDSEKAADKDAVWSDSEKAAKKPGFRHIGRKANRRNAAVWSDSEKAADKNIGIKFTHPEPTFI